MAIKTWRDQLQDKMEHDGIMRIAHFDGFYSVAIRGNILGTGLTLEDAYQDAIHYREKAA